MTTPEKVLCIDDVKQNPYPFEFPLEFPNGEIARGAVYHVTGTGSSGDRLLLLGFPVLQNGKDVGFSRRRFKVLR